MYEKIENDLTDNLKRSMASVNVHSKSSCYYLGDMKRVR